MGGLTNASCASNELGEQTETALEAVPVWSSEQFATALKEAGANVILDVRKGMTCLEKNPGGRGVVALRRQIGSSKQHVL